jgi:hydroxymethylpyrimidine/phosphomethylpyrimidine kinase
MTAPVVLTIAGSDSGGGAGVQADIKTFEAHGVFGTSALTCVTAQNPDAVTGVQAISPDAIHGQIAAVCSGFTVAAAKTGMLHSANIIRVVAESLEEYPVPFLVVDPVMVATSGARLLDRNAVSVLREVLMPRATVITPNIPEAEALADAAIVTLNDLSSTAAKLAAEIGTGVVLKGGHLDTGADVVDVLATSDGGIVEFRTPRVRAAETHGTGCTFSAALAAQLALGASLQEAAAKAQSFVALALKRSDRIGAHAPLAWKKAGQP